MLTNLILQFNTVLGLKFKCPSDLRNSAEKFTNALGPVNLHSEADRKKALLAIVNSRAHLNKKLIKNYIDAAAKQKVFFNYQQRAQITDFFNLGDEIAYNNWSQKSNLPNTLDKLFLPVSEEETIEGLNDLMSTGRVNRSDARVCDLEEKQILIQRALFGCFIFKSYKQKEVHQYFNNDNEKGYFDNFFDHIKAYHPEQLHRERALIYVDVDLPGRSSDSYSSIAERLLSTIKAAYEQLANHCYFAIRLRDDGTQSNRKWKLFSEAILFAEKHKEVKLKKGYFRPEKIKTATQNYIKELNIDAASFEVANEGFFFKDCFILSSSTEDGTNNSSYDSLLIFEKNERDERVIPCPICRSKKVGGNSYPTLGVRSWECKNSICPGRSIYNRGHRYSLASIIKQEAVGCPQNQIKDASLRRWRNDVVFGATDEEVLGLLIDHFSLNDDTILVLSADKFKSKSYQRSIIQKEQEDFCSNIPNIRKNFMSSSFFKRFAIERTSHETTVDPMCFEIKGKAILKNGDSEVVLNNSPENYFDGAVTSPPYYNAREYSQWPNIYCYLYDMYNSARAVFRVLKPGSIYIFNIFDYFDNENILAHSAMGKKRMILGAYIIYLFEKCGFEIVTNTVWYKGEIEGKRNFNQGNKSPYYQLPFNCWEHCFIFQKPPFSSDGGTQKQILKQKPVFKMIKGKNVHGHSAPFPPQIPNLLLDKLSEGQKILDPYGGSMTSVTAAIEHKIQATAIELDSNYYNLGIEKVSQYHSMLASRSTASAL